MIITILNGMVLTTFTAYILRIDYKANQRIKKYGEKEMLK